MSNRYVWKRFNLGESRTNVVSDGDNRNPRFYLTEEADLANESSLLVTYGTSYSRNGAVFRVSPATNVTINNRNDWTIYSETIDDPDAQIPFDMYFYINGRNSRVYHFAGAVTTDSAAYVDAQLMLEPDRSDEKLDFFNGGANSQSTYSAHEMRRIVKGTANGTVSNSASSTYPQDGISGNYWYTYQGQDVIDATAVGYSNQAPMGGQPITINVTPRTPTYGGTIRYTYQVQLSGGAWTTISSNNTATSLQYTIPAGTTTFAARVLASDTWGFSSSDYTTGATLTVTNNLPPSAPDGITIGDVLGGQQCTITWGAATDSDGTIDHYELERQVDNGDTWTQIFSGNALTYSDTINSEWATVNYRVRAVDDDAEPGPYTTGTMKTVNAGWLYFSGPAADMGDKPAPFDFVFSIGSTTEGVTDISVEVLLDDEIIYTGTPDAAEQVSVHIDTRLMFAGEHVLVITAEKQNLLGLNQECTFTVPAVTLPDGGRMVQLYNDEGQAVFPLTLGRAVIGKGGEDVNEILDRVFSGTYTGTGTSGSQNPCQLRLSFVPRFMFVYSNAPASGWWVRTADATTSAQGTMETTGGTATVTWDNDNMTLSWYAASAAVQLNASGTVYGYMIIG